MIAEPTTPGVAASHQFASDGFQISSDQLPNGLKWFDH
jgi:hypothetical protein